MIHRYLFMEEEDAILMGTSSHRDPEFQLYESCNLQSVGLCERVQYQSYPRFLPRPYDISSVQAAAVKLALVQYYDMKGWKKDMKTIDLVMTEINRRACPNKKPGGGFVIGDGTGVGKTRELAAFVVSVILYQKAMHEAQLYFGPAIFGHDSSDVINAVRDGSWKRSPFFIWMTCSKPLFNSCQEGMKEVVTNSKANNEGSWKPTPDKPSAFKGGGKSGAMLLSTKNVINGNDEEINIRFYTLQDVKDYVDDNNGGRAVDFFTAAPTILFMTYSDLNANLEFVLKFVTGGTNLDSNVMVPIDNFITAILCDEFHQPKNISEAFRAELQVMWEEIDQRVLSNTPRPSNPSVSELVGRFKRTMCEDKRFNAKRMKSKKGSNKQNVLSTSAFLSLLRQSDSFRFLLEVIKYDTFTLMASATPFQCNADLHSIDHILRRSIPAYTSIGAFRGGGNKSIPDAIAENSEYATLFLEQAVKLLRNRGQLVSRCISIANVECSVVNCNTTPLQKYALDELSSYCLNAKQILLDCKDIGMEIADALNVAADHEGIIPSKCVDEIIFRLNLLNTAADPREIKMEHGDLEEPLLRKMDKRFTAVMVDDSDVAHDGHTSVEAVLRESFQAELDNNDSLSSPSETAQQLFDILQQEEAEAASTTSAAVDGATQLIFKEMRFEKLRRQYFINTASTSVGACKSALLAVKACAVSEAIKRLRLSPEPKKAVMSLEQTGDAFLSNLTSRIFTAPTTLNNNCAWKNHHGIIDLNAFDSSPLANLIFAGYRLLCRAVAISSTVKFKTGPRGSKTAYIMLVPALPPVEPLVALSGNSLDAIAQRIGETKHAEITNRKLCSRITQRGMMVLRPNRRTSNTNRCVQEFNNSHQVDVMVLGPKGSTGFSLHDSQHNAVAARRIHCLLDVPFNATSFLQTIGRTHRNGQASIPHFLIFSTDSPAENRFFDCLETRVKDTMAGTFADRYSNNSISFAAAVNREQFLDKGLVLRTMGRLIQIITSDITQIELIDVFSKMMIATNAGVYAFPEGLNARNSFFVEILLSALHITLVAINQFPSATGRPEQLTRAIQFNLLLDEQVLYSVVSAAAKFAFSNFCLNLVYHSTGNASNGELRLRALSEAAKALIDAISAYRKPEIQKANRLPSSAKMLPARTRDASLDVYCDILSDRNLLSSDNFFTADEQNPPRPVREELILQIAAAEKPQNLPEAINSSKSVVTVRFLGMGQKDGVIPIKDCFNLPASGALDLLPLVTASTVIDVFCQENPALIFQLLNAAVPHRQFKNPLYKTSHVLNLARMLSKGSLNFRQFQNHFFSPRKESQLMYKTFSNVKSVMARDDRLAGLCETRMNSVMGASYIKIRRRPECVFIARLLNPILRRHVAYEEEEGGGGGGKHRSRARNLSSCAITGEGHDLDIVMSNGTSVTLTKKNSAFVAEHIDCFVAGNLLGADGSILQLCFDNCDDEFYDMPKFCLYYPSSIPNQND